MAEKKPPGRERLPLVTPVERAATVTGGAVDDRIPEEKIRRRLQDEGAGRLDVAPILAVVARQAGQCRGFQNPGHKMPVTSVHLSPAEVSKQAELTCETIDALFDRLDTLHPDLGALANDALYLSRGEFLFQIKQRISPDLYRIRAAVQHAGKVAGASGKPGPKHNPWMQARDQIAAALREHSRPSMSGKAAQGLAADLLELCGLLSPRKR